MITRDLLSSLKRLESELQSYSFDALGAQDAVVLKQKFTIFKNDLNSKVTDDCATVESEYPQKFEIDSIPQSAKVYRLSHELLGKVNTLKKSKLDEEQYKSVASIELAASIILELVMNHKRA